MFSSTLAFVDAGKTEQQVADLKAQIDAAHIALNARLAVERERPSSGIAPAYL